MNSMRSCVYYEITDNLHDGQLLHESHHTNQNLYSKYFGKESYVAAAVDKEDISGQGKVK